MRILLFSLFLALTLLTIHSHATDRGPLISIELRDVEIKDLLRALGQDYNLNIVVDESVSGKITVSFQKVPLWDVIDAVLKTKNLTYTRENEIVKVSKSALTDDGIQLTTKVYPLNFIYVTGESGITEIIKPFLSKRGTTIVDARTNNLIVRDIPETLERIDEIVIQLSGTETPQVMIEARIVETTQDFARELGVQWGAGVKSGNSFISGGGSAQTTTTTTTAGTPTSTTSAATTFNLPSGTMPSGPITALSLTGGVGIAGEGFMVNLPAAIGPGAGGAFGFGYLGKKLALDMQLSAMESTGKGKILSSPKILTLNNKKAKISSDTTIRVRLPSTSSTGGTTITTATTVQEISAGLILVVTPQITSEGNIVLNVAAEKSEPDWSRAVDGIPPISKSSAETNLLVRDADTVVIGGILSQSESNTESAVPALSKIPLLGWLFKKDTKQTKQKELLIFITPTIQKITKAK